MFASCASADRQPACLYLWVPLAVSNHTLYLALVL